MTQEIFEEELDPWLRYDQLPGALPSDHEISASKPTGYYPDARTKPQAPYDRAEDQADARGYIQDLFPQEPFHRAERIDQHPFLHVSATWTPSPDGNGRRTGTQDPLLCGPARPDTVLLSLFEYRGAGTGNTRYMDVPDGRVFPEYGSQDGSSWIYYQDADAAIARLDTTGSPLPSDPSQNPTAQSTSRKLPPGPTHGWTSVPVVNDKQTQIDKALRDLRQQKSPHQDRKANSTYAGQTYSQRTASVTQAAGPGSGQVDDPWRDR